MSANPSEIPDAQTADCWLTRVEAGAYTRFDPRLVDQAARAGELRSFCRAPGRKRKRGERRYLKSDLDRWMCGQPPLPPTE
jgi:hypothetical protein